jgi:biotin carboxyl carrier protein
MRQYQITVDGRTFEVRLLSDPREEQVQVEVNGKRFTVAVQTPTAEAETVAKAPVSVAAPSVGEASTSLIGTVVAPLPGVIKSVLARPGQRVAAGDSLLVIEAMKMDNVIRAPREGIIEIIHVAEGHRIAHGQPMLQYRE